ncbi:MAG: ferredoxin--NADP reductase [Pirellulales bacterium]|nr:ferredoxin--NADP reductase [Pirellulales bacterium]
MSDAKPDAELNAVVTQRMEVAPGLIILQVAPRGWELPAFESGQYAVLGLPPAAPRCPGSEPDPEAAKPERLIKRAYSIASSSVANSHLEFYVALVRSGGLTPRLWALRLGDPVWLGRKVTGMFTLGSVPPDVHVVLFSTGTGIAPYISMLRTFLAEQCHRRFVVVHGARHSWDLGYQSELIALHRVCRNFDYVPIISRPQEEPISWSGLAGHCQDVWTSRVVDRLWGFRPTPENTHVFLCGNPAMIEDMLQLLAQDGFREHTKKAPGQMHLEKYWT